MERLAQFKVNLDDFTLIPIIGTGGNINEYKIKHKTTNKVYIAEVYRSYNENDKEIINNMINILIDLNHPAINKYLGYSLHDFHGDDNVTLIRDYASNGRLSKILDYARNGQFIQNFDNTAKQIILVGIAHAMMYLHRNNIVYRDIKPYNILLDENFRPYLSDFKTAAFYKDIQDFYGIYGTPAYLSPESFKDYIYDEKTDVYSFGITMFEIITEQPLYPKTTNRITLSEEVIKGLRPEFKTQVKPTIKNLIEKCWSKNPSERPTFETLFNLLAYGKNNQKIDIFNEDGDRFTDDYLLDLDVDFYEVRQYADQLCASRQEVDMNQQELIQKVLKLEKEKNSCDLEMNILRFKLENIEEELHKLKSNK